MKKKGVFLSIAVVLVLLAIYGIWHYSPLRYLTQSPSESNQSQAAANQRIQPVVVAKKILPQPEITQQTEELPPPLVALKQMNPAETSEPDKSQVQIEVPAAAETMRPHEAPAGEKKPLQEAPETQAAAPGVASESSMPAKPAKPLPTQKQVALAKQEAYHPYSIMLSSCRLPQSARKIVSDYKKSGLTPYVVKVKFQSGDEWLRVLTGHYQTRRDALKAKKDLQLTGAIVKRTPYTNLIGTYTSQDQLQADLQKIKKLGYSPYFLKTAGGEHKLLVGAFVTKEGAENLQAELQAKGIQSMVVNR